MPTRGFVVTCLNRSLFELKPDPKSKILYTKLVYLLFSLRSCKFSTTYRILKVRHVMESRDGDLSIFGCYIYVNYNLSHSSNAKRARVSTSYIDICIS